MTRLLRMVLLLALAVVLTACPTSSGSAGEDGDEDETAEEVEEAPLEEVTLDEWTQAANEVCTATTDEAADDGSGRTFTEALDDSAEDFEGENEAIQALEAPTTSGDDAAAYLELRVEALARLVVAANAETWAERVPALEPIDTAFAEVNELGTELGLTSCVPPTPEPGASAAPAGPYEAFQMIITSSFQTAGFDDEEIGCMLPELESAATAGEIADPLAPTGEDVTLLYGRCNISVERQAELAGQ